MLFTFKQSPEDFIVDEILGYNLQGQGHFFYVYFEKKELNTMDLIAKRSTHRGIERKTLGISGIKDRNAITRQWISIPEDVVETEGGEKEILGYLQQDITVLQSDRHDQHLEIGRHQANQFTITLKAKKKADPAIKKLIETEREKIRDYGFPNCFGIQRFGPGNKNYHKAVKLLEQAETIPDSQYVLRFIVQAYPSMLFNHYAMDRWRKKQLMIDGDIVVTDPTPRRKDYCVYQDGAIRSCNYTLSKQLCRDQLIGSCESTLGEKQKIVNEVKQIATGPLLGMQTVLPPTGTPAYDAEYSVYKNSLCDQGYKLLKRLHLYGGRRPLVVIPNQTSIERVGEDLKLGFTLPTGSFATILLAQLFGVIDEFTCTQNRWIIPL